MIQGYCWLTTALSRLYHALPQQSPLWVVLGFKIVIVVRCSEGHSLKIELSLLKRAVHAGRSIFRRAATSSASSTVAFSVRSNTICYYYLTLILFDATLRILLPTLTCNLTISCLVFVLFCWLDDSKILLTHDCIVTTVTCIAAAFATLGRSWL